MNIKNIKPYNNKNQRHGYWEVYLPNGKLYYKGNYINNEQIGYWEIYEDNSKITCKEYHIL